MRAAVSLLIVSVALGMWAPPSFAQGEDADKKTLRRLLPELELMPSLYAKGEQPVKFKTLPKFSAQKLAGFTVEKTQTAAKERERYLANREQYAKAYPLRAAIFEAAAEMEKLQTLQTPMTLQAADLPSQLFLNGRVKDPQWEYCPGCGLVGVSAWLHLHLNSPGSRVNAELLVALRQKQAPTAEAILNLQQILQQMREADAERDKEKSKRWLADFDFALARVETNLVFLFEYNYTLGQVRADQLPDLGKEHDGWKIVSQAKVTIPEYKAKVLAKERFKLLAKIQSDYPETPWAYFAQRESRRELGMQWAAKKK